MARTRLEDVTALFAGLAGAGGAPDPGDGLADLWAVEEPGGAPDEVGDAAARQGLLERLGLRVDAEQDGDLTEVAAVGAEPEDPGGDGLGLGHLVGMGVERHLGTGGLLGAQVDALAGGAGEQRVGGLDDLGRRAVVADQLDRGGAGELGREVAQEVGVGPGEGVDRLRRVADHAELVAAAEPEVEERGLERRDVLELVDDEPLVLSADLSGDAFVLGEHPGGQQQDVLHVHPALVALDLLVGVEDVGDDRGGLARDRAAARLGDVDVRRG